MQITEQIIERIARRTFNSMFAPALRQSNVVIGGGGSSVSWADNAGHANEADTATTAGSADTAASASAAPWTGITGKPATATRWPAWSEVTNKPSTFAPSAHTHDYIVPKSTITYGANYLQYDDVYATEASNPANAIGNPTADWYHHIVMNHANAGGYFVDMALCFHSNAFYYRRIVNGTANDWVRVLDSGNSSVSKSGSTLTVKINGTEQSLTDTNTWRPVVNNLSSTDTTSSLSAAMGKDLYDYITTLQGYFDANGNAKSALKLTTVSKTAWGKTFWTTGGVPTSISGDMTSVGDISFAASGKKIGGFLYFDTANDRIGVGVDTPLSTLHVGGAARFAGNVFPAADYATTEYSLGLSDKRWKRVYAHFCELYGTAAACHVGTSSSARISLHWAGDNKRGLYDYTGNWVIGTNGTNTFLSKGNVGIGTTSPSYKLHVSGQIYCTGGFTFLSDVRKKKIIDYNVKLSVADIANAPLIHYTLKDDPLRRVRIGSIAQYWEKVLPESVNADKEGTLSMSYDLQAHTAVVVLARRVQELEKMIYHLQTRMA